VLHELHAEMTGEELRTTTVRAYVETWLAEKTEETKPATLQFYKSATAKFLKSLGEKADGDLAYITRQEILSFRKSLAGQLSPTSINHDLKCIRMLFKAAHREGLIPENPAESVETAKEQETCSPIADSVK
jgi:site-specific recombinase XerD